MLPASEGRRRVFNLLNNADQPVSAAADNPGSSSPDLLGVIEPIPWRPPERRRRSYHNKTARPLVGPELAISLLLYGD